MELIGRPHEFCATLCYMSSNREDVDDRVGIRELRQHLTKYLRRVTAGETLRVTDRGKPVALFTPLPERSSPIERLVATGRLRPARRDLLTLGSPEEVPGISLSAALQEQRED